MIVISVCGWDHLLYMIVEPNEQLWLGESTILRGTVPAPHLYSIPEFLAEWHPPQAIRQ